MPKKRQPSGIWYGVTRREVWERDNRSCVRCKKVLTLEEAHIDHIQSGKRGTNDCANLRTLCRRDHVLREDSRHRGMIAAALRDGIIDGNWRSQLWPDSELD